MDKQKYNNYPLAISQILVGHEGLVPVILMADGRWLM